MTRTRLDPGAYGFPTRCFVCEPANPAGLQVAYSYDDSSGLVEAEFTLGPQYSGAPNYVHGGVVMALLDEAMAWTAIAAAGRFAVVRENTTNFEHGVMVGRPHRIEARLERTGSIRMEASAVLLNGDGKRCARARSRLVVLSREAAKSAIGEVDGEALRFLREESS
ncbi:MAG: PaaI family thioesterase [Actinomycetota bacterium]|jgi:acyl-coenzyme A thioesterase PaaI-like protein